MHSSRGSLRESLKRSYKFVSLVALPTCSDIDRFQIENLNLLNQFMSSKFKSKDFGI